MTDYHWSPSNQRGFLDHLATTGNIAASATSVGMSKQAAYAFCGRGPAGAAFQLGWDAAVLLARRRVEGELLERALEGQEESYERDADTGRVTRTRVHNGLSMAMLTRLDRMALGRNDVPAETAMARIVSQDFDAYLDLIEGGATGAAAMLFVAARDGGLYSLAGRTIDASEDEGEDFATHSQLAQIPASSSDDAEDESEELTPEDVAAEMSVWYCEYSQGWRTNFPPPTDFYGEEDGEFGENGYERDLSEEEAEARGEQAEAENAPLREAGEAARRAWFGLGEDAEASFGPGLDPGLLKPHYPEPTSFDRLRTNGEAEAPITCHPRKRGDPWSDVEADNDASVEPEAQAMDPRVHGDDNEGSEGDFASEVKPDEPALDDIEYKSNAPTMGPPPEDPDIRVIHCKPVSYYGNTTIPQHIARQMGLGGSYG